MTPTIAHLVFSPNPTPERLQMMRNMLACQFESARAMTDQAPFGANMMLGLAIDGMLRYHYWHTTRAVPRDTDFLAALDRLDHDLGQLARQFQTATDLSVRWSLAGQIAAVTLQPGEWVDSPLALAG
ncbi:MAG: hypothetical protein JXA10_01100 [Anaerolineae bacterium]|nr:hypothetical protein [Anaerolineae bacterium]